MTKDIETMNKNQEEMITISEMKNTLGGIKSRLGMKPRTKSVSWKTR